MAQEPKKPNLHWTNWVTFFLAIVLFVGSIVWAAHYEIGKLNDRLTAIEKHLSKVETATRIIGAKQGGDTKTLVDEALTAANKASRAGRTDTANAILDYTNRLLEEQTAKRVPATPEYFQHVVTQLNKLDDSPGLFPTVFSTKVTLASYRSSLESSESEQQLLATGPFRERSIFISILSTSNDDLVDHCKFNLGEGEEGIRLEGPLDLSRNIVVKDTIITHGMQRLDGIHWRNVVFVDARIEYEGGQVELDNVHFINTVFDVRPAPRSNQFVEYAALLPLQRFVAR